MSSSLASESASTHRCARWPYGDADFCCRPPPPRVYSMFPEHTTRGSFSLAHVATTAYHSAPPAATTVATTTTRAQEEDHKITSLGFRVWGLHRRQLSLLPGPDITCAEAVLFDILVFCSRGFECRMQRKTLRSRQRAQRPAKRRLSWAELGSQSVLTLLPQWYL